ncbi:MAG TPA: urea ABC transporter permease subunit UrtC [Terriglobia bacterium]|nr:urea ABC transporter permease subunit UrtC [Terriglobia bacterium]
MRLKVSIRIVCLAALALAPFYLSDYHLSLLGRYLALAVLALGLALIWGRAGILSLGQGVFFGLGGYALAMHLKLVSLGPGELPDFMQWSGLDHLPWWWHAFQRPGLAIVAMLLLPALAAAGLAWLLFHRRVGGVYFALITQALALAFTTLLISQQPYTGGFNGLTGFTTFLGFSLLGAGVQRDLYWVTVVILTAAFLFSSWLFRTKFGKVLLAIRDGENRVRFLGYNAVPYKVAAFALSGLFAGIAGGLFALQVGVISPAMLGVVPSIEMVVWVAVGGRESLFGAVLGTLLVNLGKDWISSAMPNLWLFGMGLLFILVVMVFPQGLCGLAEFWPRILLRFHHPIEPEQKGGSGLHVASAAYAKSCEEGRGAE